MTGVLDEVLGKFFLLPNRFLDRAHALADAHLALDTTLVFGLEKAHRPPLVEAPITKGQWPHEIPMTRDVRINRSLVIGHLLVIETWSLNILSHCLIRLPLANGLISGLERFGFLYRTAIHIVPDVHQFLAGTGETGGFQRVFIRLRAELQQ